MRSLVCKLRPFSIELNPISALQMHFYSLMHYTIALKLWVLYLLGISLMTIHTNIQRIKSLKGHYVYKRCLEDRNRFADRERDQDARVFFGSSNLNYARTTNM